ncbi:hypothetical protein NLJ89_g4409 [Agrocybe chaxingu]|uniref:Uncharacterized protein n=1 Tax=Agrocybe chaxingu TaxID=84603 RepID=A0A9W8K2Q8_9AGAR|nr:hypothetical protein NLJ89_g4409 [Agrocybe chaxingu]
MKENNLKQAKMDAFECIETPNPTLLALVKQAAKSTHTPVLPLVQLARKTLSILEETHSKHPDLQDLAHHAIRIVGLLCRGDLEKADGVHFRQIVEDLLHLLVKVANHVNKARFREETVTRAYRDQLQSSFMNALFHIVRQGHREVLDDSDKEGRDTSLPHAPSDALQEAARDQSTPVNYPTLGISLYPSSSTSPPTSASPFGDYPISGHLQPYALYPSNMFAPGFPMHYPPVYPYPFLPPPGTSNTNNSGNIQNIIIANNHQYFTPPRRTSRLLRRRPREPSILDQLRLAQDVAQTISPPFWHTAPPHEPTTFAGQPLYGTGLPVFVPGSSTPYSAFTSDGSSPTPYLPPSPLSWGTRNVQDVGMSSSATQACRYK